MNNAEPNLPAAGASSPTGAGAHPQAELPNRPPLAQRIAAYRLLWILAIAIFALDQLTKVWIASRIPFDPFHHHEVEVISGFFYLIHVGNTGAAWSMFSGKSVLLALLAASTLVAIFFWRHSLGLRHRTAQICFGLLCGGIVGNLVDRLVHGHVIDFLDFHFGSYVYPTFNVADSGICIGVLLYIWLSLREGPEPKDSQPKS